MKAIKFFAMALVALTFMGCPEEQPGNGDTPNNPQQETTLALDQTSITINVEETATINATVDATWASSNPAVATVAGEGKVATVTAVAEGNSVITATTAGGQTKTCVVLVKKESTGTGDGDENQAINAKRIWPIVLDGVTAQANESIIAGDIRPDPENGNNLDIWAAGETYTAGGGTGVNYFGNTEGYVSLIVAAPNGWSGGGFNIGKATSIQAMKDVKAAIVANPDKMFLHIGIKATTEGNHEFYLFGNDATAFNIGKAAVEKGEVIGDFTRDGSWYGFDIPMAQFVNTIAGTNINDEGQYIMSFLSGNAVGSQLNLDAVYFYEK
ncbi:MAG: Ig-like domain-containing protein [Paludibacteraceae bacterium]|nr:Ig-like domain-containing protein [Paludibacteraceae bacterium]